MARFVLVGRPEPRRVGGQYFVGKHNFAAGATPSEFEFRVGQDDAACSRDLLGAAVGRERQPLELGGSLGADCVDDVTK